MKVISREISRYILSMIGGVQAFFGPGNAKGNFKVIEETSKEWLKQARNRIKQ